MTDEQQHEPEDLDGPPHPGDVPGFAFVGIATGLETSIGQAPGWDGDLLDLKWQVPGGHAILRLPVEAIGPCLEVIAETVKAYRAANPLNGGVILDGDVNGAAAAAKQRADADAELKGRTANREERRKAARGRKKA